MGEVTLVAANVLNTTPRLTKKENPWRIPHPVFKVV